ncbi:hypothetical protein SAMN04488109_0863 [Chryseolinea serpens]|uniref:PAP2 superfamily protein n=1 Tax=Chryseolinea serpens TaxID=947013 RepID=A0A1M5KV96_9BACT|nr:vanadium-dependent haloperoxidase [Chryseolinea serpens]SHG56782.1 hypothetical protein SAMN04488109_0863 [Chryseolinea serpens]
MKKYLSFLMMVCLLVFSTCQEHWKQPAAKKYSSTVATTWINLQQKLTKTTAGYSPGVTGRAFAYTGLSLYESIVPGMPGYRSILPFVGGPTTVVPADCQSYYWPASANAAMASMIRNLFESTSAANKVTIDSLEDAFNTQFQGEAHATVLQNSANFGRSVAEAIFEWSKTDGSHEAYKPQPNTYVPPVGPGLWIPTPPAFLPAASPYVGNDRSFTPGIAAQTQPTTFPLPPYSEEPGSDFYNMVNFSYTLSQSLTPADIITAKTWADIPGNFNGTAHFTNIATQLIILKKLKLDEAALVYAKHGIALRDAIISVFKTKYRYNVIRPISYIRNVMGFTTWNTVVPTPPHPEYASAHTVIGKASSVVLESFFGKKCAFVDRTHEATFGARSYNTLAEYAEDGAWSRVLAGIHYNKTAADGLIQGKAVGNMVNSLPFKVGHDH